MIFACSAPACWPGFITPTNGSTVPANLPAIHWRPANSFGSPAADPAMVTLTTTADPSTPLAFTATMLPGGDYALVPNSPLAAGTSYVVTDGNACGTGVGPTVTFTAGAMAPLPTQLGTLTITTPAVAPLTVLTSSGSCSTEVSAVQASLDLALAGDAAPWANAMLFETRVNGTLWSPQAAIHVMNAPGMMIDRVFHTCQTTDQGADDGLTEGHHDVVVQATLPGTTTMLSTSAASVDLWCNSMWPDDIDDDELGGCCSAADSAGGMWIVAIVALLLWRRR